MRSLLELSNVNYEGINVGDLEGGLKGPEFAKINPKGIVPTVLINGKMYPESASTMRLLANLLPSL